MVSLTTVYIVSVILTSIAGMGSAFVAKRFTGGGIPPSVNIKLEDLSNLLQTQYGYSRERADQVTDIIRASLISLDARNLKDPEGQFIEVSNDLQNQGVSKTVADMLAKQTQKLAEEVARVTTMPNENSNDESIPQTFQQESLEPSTEQNQPEVPLAA